MESEPGAGAGEGVAQTMLHERAGGVNAAPFPYLIEIGVERSAGPEPKCGGQIRCSEPGEESRQRAIAPKGARGQHEQALGVDREGDPGGDAAPERAAAPGEVDRGEMRGDQQEIGRERHDGRLRVEREKEGEQRRRPARLGRAPKIARKAPG